MDDNPYRTPQADVSDGSPAAQGSRPQTITWAVRLMWTSLCLSLPMLLPSVAGYDFDGIDPIGVLVIIGIQALLIGLLVVLIMMIDRGHNWARWAWVGFGVAGYGFVVGDLASFMEQGALAQTIQVLTFSLDLSSAVLLFRRESGAWFKHAR